MKILLSLCLLIASIHAYAQTESQILKALQTSSHPLDEDADYSYLVNASSIKYVIPADWDLYVTQSYNKTFKIYNDEGLEMANVTIPLWKSKTDRERIKKMKVRLHKLVNGIVKTQEIKIDKYEEKNENIILYKFTVPGVNVGDVLEVKYMLTSPYVTVLPRFYFQQSVPVDSAQYTIDVPGYFGLSPNLKGYENIQVTDKKLNSDHYEKRYMLKAIDIKPMDNPSYVMNPNDYRSSIKYEIESYQKPGQAKVKLSSTWDDVGDNIWDAWNIGKSLKSKKFKGLPDFESIQDTLDKIKVAIDYIHNNFTWNEEFLDNKPNLKNLIKNKTGNLLEINLSLINILTQNGIEAAPLITQKRKYGYISDKFPSRGNFNNILTYIKLGKGYIIVDPSDKNLDLGQVSISNRNFSGLILHKEKDAEFFYFDTKNIYKKQTQAKVTITDDSNLDIFKKEKLSSSAKATYTRSPNSYLAENYKLENVPTVERNKPIQIEYTYTLNEAVMNIENKMILPVCIDCPISLIDMQEEERNYPLILSSTQKQTYIYQLTIPEGYTIETLPENDEIKNYNGMATMSFTAKSDSDKITVSILYEIKKEVFTPKEYKTLKIAIDKMKDKLNESIVLVKT